jgi:carboxyl-terminal processing protease
VKDREQIYKKIAEIDKTIRQNYSGTIDEDVLLDSISKGYLGGIGDKYAHYYSTEELKKFKDDNDGTLDGIGVRVELDESGYIRIAEVYENSSAKAAKLQKGDLIIKVADKDVKATGYSESVELMRGEAGTKVKVVIRRNGADQDPIELIRKKVVVPSVWHRMIGNNGYVQIADFNASTVDQFKSAIEDLIKQDAKSLIFDVRNNPGGTLDSVTDMLDMLLPEGTIATATYNDGKTKVLAKSDSDEIKLPMVVLTNNSTASAAELFVAALRDYNKVKVVGINTYGKGVMQTTFTLKDGSGVQLTTAYFNPPKSENFNGVGIKPDYEIALSAEQEKDFSNLTDKTDPQILKAVEIANSLT